MWIKIQKEYLFAILIVFYTNAFADNVQEKFNTSEQCALVSLKGTGRMTENGRIEGTEILSFLDASRSIQVDFTMVPLATAGFDGDTGVLTLDSSHRFSAKSPRHISFTTFDEIRVIPLNGKDPTCTANPCGLTFKLTVETGRGRFNCGKIVSGINTAPGASVPFDSFVNPTAPAPNGDTVFLNSMGKLCRCR